MSMQHTIPTLSSAISSQQINPHAIERQLHKAISSAISTYNDWIEWVDEQMDDGHIDQRYLQDLVTSSYRQGSHISPIEEAINGLYIADPKWVSLIEGSELKMPNQWVHQAAKLLTIDRLAITDFPPICHTLPPAV